MLTYELKKAPAMPLYEALYRCIRDDILSGKLAPNEKLPSKRALCANLKVSKITVEGAYNQLLDQGYIRSREKVGYFVEPVQRVEPKAAPISAPAEKPADRIDLTANGPAHFPFSVWSRLQREVMLDLGEKLLLPLHNQGLLELRQAIAAHLGQFRGMQVDPRNVLIGAGTDFLYNLLIQLLGQDKLYGVEEPGYDKIRRIYAAGGAACTGIRLDVYGVNPEQLGQVQVLHISPSHHFPTGIVTPLHRRQALLNWAKEQPDRYIIEDDYDSEFRFAAHPLPTMQSLDTSGRVIYLNTFTKTLAPSIRISYMVLPQSLMEQFHQRLGFYNCTVSSFEQFTLARFLDRGYFEKHINRMRKFYKSRRDRLVAAIEGCSLAERLDILEENAGLHFIVRIDSRISMDSVLDACRKAGIRVRPLSSYYHGQVPSYARNSLVVNYSGLTDNQTERLEHFLQSL